MTVNIEKSLKALSLERIQNEADNETTTAFNAIRVNRLESAVDDSEGNHTSGNAGFELVIIINSNRVPTTEALCWTSVALGTRS